jgi:hypothetical protein
VLRRVGGQLQQRLRDPLRVDLDGALGALVELPGAVGQGTGLVEDLVGQHARVHLDGLEEVGAPGLGQHDHVVDQSCHPVDLVEHQVPGGLGVADVVGVQQLEVATHDRDRRTQLVAGVVEEPALLHEGVLQPVEHRVEGVAQVGDVVIAGGVEPPAEVGVADLLRRRSHLP